MSKNFQWHGVLIYNAVKALADVNEKKSAENIERDAIRYCPEATEDGGDLKATIRAQKSSFKDGGYVVVAGDEGVPYASYVELGVPAHGIEKRPFMRRAAKKEIKRFWRRMKRAL